MAETQPTAAAGKDAAAASDEEDLTPVPTQEELDNVKLGLHHAEGAKAAYKTRQAKSA